MCSNRRETGSDTLELRKKPIAISPQTPLLNSRQYFECAQEFLYDEDTIFL